RLPDQGADAHRQLQRNLRQPLFRRRVRHRRRPGDECLRPPAQAQRSHRDRRIPLSRAERRQPSYPPAAPDTDHPLADCRPPDGGRPPSRWRAAASPFAVSALPLRHPDSKDLPMLQWITRPGWPGHLLAYGAGALTTLALAPFDLWPLAVLSIALFYFGLRHLRPGQAALRGWSYGFGLFTAGTSWVYVSIHDYGAASPALAGILTLGFVAGLGLFFALTAALWARWIRRSEAPLADALAF